MFDGPRGLRIGVLNLIGRCEMDSNFENPFTTADRILKEADCDVVLVDFHAEATSEKGAMAFIWTAGPRRCGGPIPMCPRRMRRCWSVVWAS